jgi:hypothetical protein
MTPWIKPSPIVAKVEQLMVLVDALDTQLAASRNVRERAALSLDPFPPKAGLPSGEGRGVKR